MRKEEKVKIRIRHSKIGKKRKGERYVKGKVSDIVREQVIIQQKGRGAKDKALLNS